ncbi:MAG: hypothetical protein DME03_08545 [Candidatus Rokuibacteriota bacterium]|nr:MAG: hypothetical protein DME03_08545 [Candidatus Rokubacteria bacterium]
MVVHARVACVPGLEALDLDVAVVDQIAAGHAPYGLEPAVEPVAGGIGSQAGGHDERQESREDRAELPHRVS